MKKTTWYLVCFTLKKQKQNSAPARHLEQI